MTATCLLALALVPLVASVVHGEPPFVPCVTHDGPGYQTTIGDLQCIFTRGGVLFVCHPAPVSGVHPEEMDNLVPGSRAQKAAMSAGTTLFRLDFDGNDASLLPEGRLPRQELVNIYKGRAAAHWLQARPMCAEIVYPQIRDGVDLVFTQTASGLAYELIGDVSRGAGLFTWTDIAPGPGKTAMKAAEIRRARLLLSADFGIAARGTLQWLPETRVRAPASVPIGTKSLDLSGLAWATYCGGSSGEYSRAIGLAAEDRPVVGGFTWSTDYPITAGALDDTLSGMEYDAMVTAFDPSTGHILWSTYLGGSDLEEVQGVGRAISGDALVAGWTWSADFPTTAGSYDTTLTTAEAAIVVDLDAMTGQLKWSTLMNGTAAHGVAVAREGGVCIVGRSYSGGAPVTAHAYDRTFRGGSFGDGIVARLSSDGRRLDWCTYLGGSGLDYLGAIAVGEGDNVAVAGYTAQGTVTAEHYPTTPGAYDTLPGTGTDGVVSMLGADGDSLIWSSYVGSDKGNWFHAVSVLANGAVAAAGYSTSALYPVTADAFQSVRNGSYSDAVVTLLSAAGSSLIYSTYLGGDDFDDVFGMCTGANGEIIVSGGTTSTTFPGPHSPDEWITSGSWDWFVAVFKNENGSVSLKKSLVLGGSGWEQMSFVARGADNSVYLLGDTESIGLPTSGDAFQPAFAGVRDLYIAKFADWVTPVMFSGLRAQRVGDWGRVEWTLSGAGSGEPVRLWREAPGVARQQVAEWSQLRDGPGSWDDQSAPAGEASYWLQMLSAAGGESWFGPAVLPAIAVPTVLALAQNHPNPFNPHTTITYSLPKAGRVKLAIFDVRGARIKALVDADQPAGEQSVEWSGTNDRGEAIPSGVYFARLETVAAVRTVKVTLAR